MQTYFCLQYINTASALTLTAPVRQLLSQTRQLLFSHFLQEVIGLDLLQQELLE